MLTALVIATTLAVAAAVWAWAGKSHAEKSAAEVRQALESRVAELKQERDANHSEKAALQEKAAQLRSQLDTTQTLLETTRQQAARDEKQRAEHFQTELQLAREQMRAQFEKELEQRSEQLKATNAEQMQHIVAPLKAELEQLRSLVDSSKELQTKTTSALEAQIRAVFEHDKERDKTTQSLAEALKNRGKVQGDWGEQVLENILRDSGLREGYEYEKQMNVKGEDGSNERPDIVVKGADGSRIVIDSKVSLTAYSDYVGAENDDERRTAVRENYDSIWRHVSELADKQYAKSVDCAIPIVLMFVPNEGSYILAMNRDPQLSMKAYRKGVIIINPTNLMVVLKLIFLMWQNTRQEENNRSILEAAAKVYDKYCTFAESYLSLGSQLTTAQTTYARGLQQLKEGRGNFSRQLETLLNYGVTPSKRMPEKIQPTLIED